MTPQESKDPSSSESCPYELDHSSDWKMPGIFLKEEGSQESVNSSEPGFPSKETGILKGVDEC